MMIGTKTFISKDAKAQGELSYAAQLIDQKLKVARASMPSPAAENDHADSTAQYDRSSEQEAEAHPA